MKQQVKHGCTLYRRDGSVWAKTGEDVEIDYNDPDCVNAMHGQRQKLKNAPPRRVMPKMTREVRTKDIE